MTGKAVNKNPEAPYVPWPARVVRRAVERFAVVLKSIVRAPFLLVSWIFDVVVSARGLALISLAICALFATGTWLRPPISKDLRGFHIPLGINPQRSLSIEQIVATTRPLVLDSIALPLLFVVALAIIPVLIAPRTVNWFAGVLMAFAMAGTAATMMNHPAIIEQLESEYEQRATIRGVMGYQAETLLSGLLKPRLDDPQFDETGLFAEMGLKPHDAVRGWMYVVYGPWLVGFAGLVVLYSTTGSVGRKLMMVGLWCVIGAALSAVVTHRRLHAEYVYQLVLADEAAQRYDAARDRLLEVMQIFPALQETDRYWITQGRLDYRLGRENQYTCYFESVRYFEDYAVDEAHAGTRELMSKASSSPVARRFAGHVFSSWAVGNYQAQNYAAAERAWAESGTYFPSSYDAAIGRGMAVASVDPDRVEEVAGDIIPLIPLIGDQVLACDMVAVVGDAYFAAGDFEEARYYYSWSKDIFNLPKTSNYHSQRGLLGL